MRKFLSVKPQSSRRGRAIHAQVELRVGDFESVSTEIWFLAVRNFRGVYWKSELRGLWAGRIISYERPRAQTRLL
jgi:hypothetical protein